MYVHAARAKGEEPLRGWGALRGAARRRRWSVATACPAAPCPTRPMWRADAAMVLRRYRSSVASVPGGAAATRRPRTPRRLCEEKRVGHWKARRTWFRRWFRRRRCIRGGGGLRRVKGGASAAPGERRSSDGAGDVALRLQTNHSKQRFAAETAQLCPAALRHSFGRQQWRRCGSGRGARTSWLEKASRRS